MDRGSYMEKGFLYREFNYFLILIFDFSWIWRNRRNAVRSERLCGLWVLHQHYGVKNRCVAGVSL